MPDNFTVQKLKQFLPHILFVTLILISAFWVYTGIEKPIAKEPIPAQEMNHEMVANPQTRTVNNADDAARSYLRAAQELAKVYRYTNNGSYNGLCEYSESLYTLEGNSGGILKFVKMVGATEVYCATSDSTYMIEVKLPENGLFFCIDEKGIPVEQAASKEGVNRCG